MFKFLVEIYNVFRCIREFVISLFFILFVLLCFFIFAALGSETSSEGENFKSGALLLNLNGYIADNTDVYGGFYQLINSELGNDEPQKISIFDIDQALSFAKDDDAITGLVLDLEELNYADLPALEYLGEKIKSFKKTGKPVIAIGNYYSQSQYYLASFADEIYLNSAGFVGIKGFNYSNVYFKSLLDKISAVPHVFRVGTYKSAVEPFLRNNMSKEARQNAELWINQNWQRFTQTIAENRHISARNVLPKIERYIDLFKKAKGNEADYALNQHLVTKLTNSNEIREILIEHFGDNNGNFKHIDFSDYLIDLPDRFESKAEHKIAVVNVEGEIVLGESDVDNAGSDTIIKALRIAGKDKKVDGVVLRVNSPGGSAMASELIRQEVEALQKMGKPVVTSMGGMAASGGYWIAAMSDYIVAHPTTVTGSIGIFGLATTFEKTAQQLGVRVDGVSTSPLASSSALKSLSAEQSTILQMGVENGYDRFLTLVSQGRKMSKADVDKVAQGQVWTGAKAQELGLVDQLGDFDVAYSMACKLVNDDRTKRHLSEIEQFDIQWITDKEPSLFGGMMRQLQPEIKLELIKELNLPMVKKIQTEINLLTKFNDPKNLYLYCLNCARLN